MGSAVTAMAGVRHLLVASNFLFFLFFSVDGDGLWGRQCVSSEMCMKPWSHCARHKGITFADGECRLNVWVWVVIVLGSILILSVQACVCCCLFCYEGCMSAPSVVRPPTIDVGLQTEECRQEYEYYHTYAQIHPEEEDDRLERQETQV